MCTQDHGLKRPPRENWKARAQKAENELMHRKRQIHEANFKINILKNEVRSKEIIIEKFEGDLIELGSIKLKLNKIPLWIRRIFGAY